MRSVREENGEMVATDELEPSIAVASFKNVAERNGYVDLRFRVIVPGKMLEDDWQIRLCPVLYALSDTVPLEPVLITGSRYRDEQLREMERFRRFLDSIETDSTAFLKKYALGIFMDRNPETMSGVTGIEAADHYTYRLLLLYNEWKRRNTDEMYRRIVRSPLLPEGLRLDTVIAGRNGAFEYEYVQRLRTRPMLRKAEISLGGEVTDMRGRRMEVSDSSVISFYISSLGGLLEEKTRYRMEIRERLVYDNSVCWLEFPAGGSVLDRATGENASEMDRIRKNIVQLFENDEFDLDSVSVCAYCSPEGSYEYNRRLSQRRGKEVCRVFEEFVSAYVDSVKAEEGVRLSVSGSTDTSPVLPSIVFSPRSVAENWDMLRDAVETDSSLSDDEKEEFRRSLLTDDPDERESAYRGKSFYNYFRTVLYPRLRIVKFGFHLHRRGMVKDTVRTTAVDSVYAAGLQALRDRDYRRAVSLLGGYSDYNSAVAYASLGYDASALSILEALPESASVDYLLAVLYSRKGEEGDAAAHFRAACEKDESFFFRGNLDPEISDLVKNYTLQ